MKSLLIGTYTRRDSEGIMSLDVDFQNKTATTKLLHKEQACTYLCRHEGHVYSVFKDDKGAGLLVLKEENDHLILVNKVYSGEKTASCHIAINSERNMIATTNYGEGSLQVFVYEDEWKLQKRLVSRKGSHQHFVHFTKDNEHIIVCDLGLNQLITYNYDFEVVDIYEFKENEGPRHLVTSEDESIYYVLGELSNHLLVLVRDGYSFTLKHRINALENPNSQGNNAAAIRITKDYKTIYTTTRNNEEMVNVFDVNGEDVTLIQQISSHGQHPRDMNLSSNEDYVIVANKDSDNIVFYKIHDQKLEKDFEVSISEPVCIAL